MDEYSAGLVLRNKDKYLLLHYIGGHWDFIKGHIEEGESLKETAIRECEEETGITDITILDGFEEAVTYYYTREKKTMHKQVQYLVGTTQEKDVTISAEHTGHAWLTYDEAMEKLTFDNAKKVLRRAKAFFDQHKPPRSAHQSEQNK